MNGYQSYLRASHHWIRLEVARCRLLGIGFGIKCVRGAYINEERRLAEKGKYQSPCWDTLEETHTNYNKNLDFLIREVEE